VNSLKPDDHRETDQQIDRALQSLSTALPDYAVDAHTAFDVMNARLLSNIRRHEAAGTSQSRRLAWWPKAGLAFVAAGAAYAVVLHLPVRKVSDASFQQALNNRSLSAKTTSQTGPQLPAKIDRAPTTSLQTARFAPATSKTENHSSAVSIDPAFLPSSPAPAAPLTHQEELLLSTARGLTPAMLAQLEHQHTDPAGTNPQPAPNPLFAGFRPEPPDVEDNSPADQTPNDPGPTSAAPFNASQSNPPNNTTATEFRP
jgi:hypothetical protein